MAGFWERTINKFLPPQDRYAALLLYGLIWALTFNGYDAEQDVGFKISLTKLAQGIMTVILADEQFIEYYDVTPGRSGVIATIPWATTGLAQLCIGGTLAALIGRIWTMRISLAVMIIGIVVQIVPNTYGVLVLGRLITGLGFGCNYISTNLYVAECAPRSLRGSFVGTVSQFGYQLGTLIAFWSGYGMSFHKSPYNIAWRISNFIQIPIGIAFLVLSKYYPESPRFLLEKHPDEPQRALAVLAKLRGGDPDAPHVQQEWQEILTSWEIRRNNPAGYMGLLKSPAMRKRLAYGFFATSLQQAGGIASLTMYAVLIYKSLGWDEGSQALAINGVQACLQLVIVLVNTFTVDKYGRKTLLLFGFAIQTAALLLMSILLSIYPNNENRPAGVVCVVCLFAVGLTYCFSNGPIAPTVASEIFPQHVRDKAFSLSLLGQTAFLLAISQPWPKFNKQVGGKSYWLLFALNAACFMLTLLFLPETKGISLEKMDELFGSVNIVSASQQQQSEVSKVSVELLEDLPDKADEGDRYKASRTMNQDLEGHKV
ncbi:hypothetical protein KEM52_004481 [Ascosphaera acerosa]|nr:hypothetical protein KEM52_004481 [Ascosphaera acerosa]